jgi:acetolactate synthase-1/2/3 large subunit
MVIVILNNNNYGMIKWKQKNEHFTDYALDFNNPDFKKLAESFGAI